MDLYKAPLKLSAVIFISIALLQWTSKGKRKQHASIPMNAQNDSIRTVIAYPQYLNNNYILGKFVAKQRDDFIQVPPEFSTKPMFLRRDVFQMFYKMALQAQQDTIDLKIISATRSFEHQKRIWNYKWNITYNSYPEYKRALKILEYSSMPGTSRHHWGTDIDLNKLNNAYFSRGKGKKEYDWLMENAHNYGFYQVYTSKTYGRTGYHEEKWHWTYAPLSSLYLNYYNQYITNDHIKDFDGAQYAPTLHMLKNYVNGINPKVKIFKP